MTMPSYSRAVVVAVIVLRFAQPAAVLAGDSTPPPSEPSSSADGLIVPSARFELSAPAGGTVESILARVGDPVTAGQPLLRLRSDELVFRADSLAAERRRLTAELERREIQLAAAIARLERLNRLPGLVSESDLGVAATDVELARAEARISRSSMSENQVRLNHLDVLKSALTLRSPSTGVVESMNVTQNSSLSQGQLVGVVASESTLARFLVGSRNPALEPGSEVLIRCPGVEPLSATSLRLYQFEDAKQLGWVLETTTPRSSACRAGTVATLVFPP